MAHEFELSPHLFVLLSNANRVCVLLLDLFGWPVTVDASLCLVESVGINVPLWKIGKGKVLG